MTPLPSAGREVLGIANLFPTDSTRVFLGSEATEEAFKSAPLRSYKRIHFATHSLLNEAKISRSGVLLTLDNNPLEDGFLEVEEILDLDLDCDLVVLSACQTGRGLLLPGEGVVGLSRAFMLAGARSVVASLWNVSDISTAQLMQNFYEGIQQGSGNADALREAKLRMLDGNNETRHPYYWAPFVLTGEP